MDNAGNIITRGFLMAEELNMHFSSVFTREDTSSLPEPGTKFNGSEGETLLYIMCAVLLLGKQCRINNSESESEKVGVVSCNPRSSS